MRSFVEDQIEGDVETPTNRSIVTWYDSETYAPWIQFNHGILEWNEKNGSNSTIPVWVRVAQKSPRYVNHVIRQVGGLLALKRIQEERAQYALDRLYEILESKL